MMTLDGLKTGQSGKILQVNGQGALRPVSGDIEDFYELVSEELYTEEMGLKMDIEEGIGVFW